MTLPKWLTDQLVADGVMTENRVTRKAKITRCPAGCGALVLAAIDDLCFETFCHPAPTTRAGELQAVLAGLRMHTLIGDELVHRGAHRINSRSADEESAYPDHRCGMHFPINDRYSRRRIRATYSDAPPF